MLVSSGTYPTATQPQSVAIAELSGDGYPDLVVAASGADLVSVLLGNGDGTFQAHVDYPTGTTPYDVAVADLDRDGDGDVVIANSRSASVSVLLGAGGGSLAPQVSYSTSAGTGRPWDIAIGHLDADPHLDLAVANAFGGSATIAILIGTGDGTFAPAIEYVAKNPWSIAIADMDRDGTADLATADGSYAAASVFSGRGDGTFAPAIDYPASPQNFSLALGDLDGDGVLDLVMPDSGTNDVTVLTSLTCP